jgi:threonylcarbamoyladenosine tRNA methylthiotransferase MtaB
LAAQLARAGHQIAASPGEADLCVLNTCAVTHVAAQKSRQALRRLHRQNPEARLVATGCYAELSPADLRDLPGIEFLAGNQDKARLAALIGGEVVDQISRLPRSDTGVPTPMPGARTRALVKIQDGCDNACTYCIIHVARGPQYSRPADQVLAEVHDRLAAGYREVVLTGVHIGAYGQDRAETRQAPDLWALVARILAETDLPRLRLSSIEPWDLPERALRLWQNPRLCRHLHLPLQSGADAVLRRMARRYTTAEFGALMHSARGAVPDMAITTDVIVGFPGESEDEFAQSLAFVQAAGFARVHVFPYSLRPGTPAAEMSGQVPPQAKAARARAMRAAGAEADQAFRQQFIGRTMDVLWESSLEREGSTVWSGLTGNYLRVYAASSEDLANRLTAARLLSLTKGGVVGEIEIKKAGDFSPAGS